MRVGQSILYRKIRQLELNAPIKDDPFRMLFIGSDNGKDIIIEGDGTPNIRLTKIKEFMDFINKHQPTHIYISFFKDKDGNWIERPIKGSALDEALKEVKKLE